MTGGRKNQGQDDQQELPNQWEKRRMNGGRRTSSSSKLSKSSPSSTLVHPSVFRYTCTGKLGLHGDASPGQARMGTCRGIASQLELVDHWRPMTHDEAVMQFQSRELASSAPTPTATAGGVDPTTGGRGSGGGVKGPSPSSPGAAAASAGALQAVHISNVLIYPPVSPGDDENDKGKKGKNKVVVGKKNSTPPSSKSTSDSDEEQQQQQLQHKEEWKCYGSTEVDLLVLRPQDSNNENIAGVSPYTSPGVTIRDVTSPTLGQERTTTIRLSILEILYQNTMSPEDMMDDMTNNSSDNNNNKNPKNTGSGDDERKSGFAVGPSKVYESGKKVAHHMKLNADLLYSSVQDDFPGRTWEASQRIGNEVEKTVGRTYNMVKRVVSWAFDGGSSSGSSSGGFGGFGG
mmetsp:Transcript_50148/g.121506  ORF Transcript_50148/g.121506 Transcript_50148/m.121506 type:complete len:402 (-) Transcript_50148:352-1557(-)